MAKSIADGVKDQHTVPLSLTDESIRGISMRIIDNTKNTYSGPNHAEQAPTSNKSPEHKAEVNDVIGLLAIVPLAPLVAFTRGKKHSRPATAESHRSHQSTKRKGGAGEIIPVGPILWSKCRKVIDIGPPPPKRHKILKSLQDSCVPISIANLVHAKDVKSGSHRASNFGLNANGSNVCWFDQYGHPDEFVRSVSGTTPTQEHWPYTLCEYEECQLLSFEITRLKAIMEKHGSMAGNILDEDTYAGGEGGPGNEDRSGGLDQWRDFSEGSGAFYYSVKNVSHRRGWIHSLNKEWNLEQLGVRISAACQVANALARVTGMDKRYDDSDVSPDDKDLESKGFSRWREFIIWEVERTGEFENKLREIGGGELGGESGIVGLKERKGKAKEHIVKMGGAETKSRGNIKGKSKNIEIERERMEDLEIERAEIVGNGDDQENIGLFARGLRFGIAVILKIGAVLAPIFGF